MSFASHRCRSKLYALGAAVGHVPRMSMGRNRWAAMPAAGGGDGMDLATLSGVRQLTPEAREVASRTYVAGEAGQRAWQSLDAGRC